MTKRLIRIFFPARCEHCKRIIPLYENGCIECESRLYTIPEEFCPHCNSRKCVCNNTTPILSHLTAPFLYSGIIKALIFRYKFGKEKGLASFFTENMLESILRDFPDTEFDYVTFVPMSKSAKKKRGFNQSELLAKSLAKRLFTHETELLTKDGASRKQHYLSFGERAENVRSAFSLKEGVSVKGKTVLLCDDIKTTGNTLLACEKVLLEGGAKEVYCCVVAIPVFVKAADILDKEDEKL